MLRWQPGSRENLVFAFLALVATPMSARAQDQHDHGHGLHFSHPMFAESVSPDTKIRLDYGEAWETEGKEAELEVEAEYAFHRSVSVELAAPYVFLRPSDGPSTSGVGVLHLALKFANYAFEERGLLLGYGLEFGLPTGNADAGTGTDHLWEIEPFLNLGFAYGGFEIVGWTRFGIPANQETGEEVETEVAYDVSALYHVSDRIQGLLELNGGAGLSGAEAGRGVVAVSPGFKVAPSPTVPIFVGLGVSVPVDDEELDARLKLSLFWHF